MQVRLHAQRSELTEPRDLLLNQFDAWMVSSSCQEAMQLSAAAKSVAVEDPEEGSPPSRPPSCLIVSEDRDIAPTLTRVQSELVDIAQQIAKQVGARCCCCCCCQTSGC